MAKGKKGSGYEKFLALPKEQRDIVDKMLLGGATAMKVVEVVRDEWGYFHDLKPDTLKRFVNRYRKGVVDKKIETKMEAAGVIDRVTKLVQDVDVVEEQVKLIHLQRDRLLAVSSREAETTLQTGLLLGTVGTEIDRMNRLLEKLAGMYEKIGILRPDDEPDALESLGGDVLEVTSMTFKVTKNGPDAMKLIEGIEQELANDGNHTGPAIEGTATEVSSVV